MTWHLLAASVGLLTLSQLAHADSLDEQRSRYAQIKQAWDNRQMDVVGPADAHVKHLSPVSLFAVPDRSPTI